MKVYKEIDLWNFEAWGGGENTLGCLSFEEHEYIQDILEDIYPEGIDETALNDILRFESDWIANMLGYKNFDEFEEVVKNRQPF